MKTDAIIIGSELDGLVAATRLCERGYSVRMFTAGAGSLHYSPDGIHVLGYSPTDSEEHVTNPFEAISRLDQDHPYRKVGDAQIDKALIWFADLVASFNQKVTINKLNELAISPAGLGIPVLGISKHQATVEKLDGKNVAIVVFNGHRDFPAELIAVKLRKRSASSRIIPVDAPEELLENAALAKSFDRLENMEAYFAAIKEVIPAETNIVLFPAVMGFSRQHEVLAVAKRVLGMSCLEVPTLPPSVPGMRLEHAFNRHLKNSGVVIHTGAEIIRSSIDEREGIVIWDNMGRQYEATTIVLSSGGILMGGLDVDSHGIIHETCLGLDTYQSEPLNALSVDQSLDALHAAGVETDSALRPTCNGSGFVPNVFVTGRSLSCWNPAVESSAKGVSITSGWAAAENAHLYMEARSNE